MQLDQAYHVFPDWWNDKWQSKTCPSATLSNTALGMNPGFCDGR
jgi:hypothetical protein